MKRRDFFKTTLGLALSGTLVRSFAQNAPVISKIAASGGSLKKAADRVTLGKTGIVASRLALGTGSNGWNGKSNQTRKMGLEGLALFFTEAYGKGINFWDAADQYGSHPFLKEALKSVPRDKVVILTKTRAESAKDMQSDLDRFRRELGTDMIDILLLHCKTDPAWPQQCQGAMEVLSKAREAGIIRAHGVSCHSFGALETAAAEPWVQIDLARINPAGVVMDAAVEKVVPVLMQMHDAGKGVIGMKIFGAGKLVSRMDECLRFVLQQDFVDSFSLGFESLEQMREGIARLDRAGESLG